MVPAAGAAGLKGPFRAWRAAHGEPPTPDAPVAGARESGCGAAPQTLNDKERKALHDKTSKKTGKTGFGVEMRGCVSAGAGIGGAASVRRPVPPCSPDCPERRAQPNCHNRLRCKAWGIFEDAMAEYRRREEAEKRKERDVSGLSKSSYRRWMRRIGEKSDQACDKRR